MGEKIFDFAEDVSPNIEYPVDDFLGWEKAHFLNGLQYFLPEWMQHSLKMDQIDDETLELRITDVNLKLNFTDTRITTLWWTLVGFDTFEVTGLNVTAIAKVTEDDQWRIDEFSSLTFGHMDMNMTDEGFELLRKMQDWKMAVNNKFGNFILEEFVIPAAGHSLVSALNWNIAGLTQTLGGWKLLEPILDRSLGTYQIALEKDGLDGNQIRPGFEPNNHTFQMYFSEAMIDDKLFGEPLVLKDGQQFFFQDEPMNLSEEFMDILPAFHEGDLSLTFDGSNLHTKVVNGALIVNGPLNFMVKDGETILSP